MMLFNKANKGASGKEATNKVTNPNWITGKVKNKTTFQCLLSVFTKCTHHHISVSSQILTKWQVLGDSIPLSASGTVCMTAAPFVQGRASCHLAKGSTKVTRRMGKLLKHFFHGQGWHRSHLKEWDYGSDCVGSTQTCHVPPGRFLAFTNPTESFEKDMADSLPLPGITCFP